jgi:hypothetical protein
MVCLCCWEGAFETLIISTVQSCVSYILRKVAV